MHPDSDKENSMTEPPSPELVVVGELNVDLIMERVQSLPELGKEKLVEGMTLTLGSSSAILASNASALGTGVGFVGRIGADEFGAFILDRLRARKLDVRHVTRSSLPTGITVIFTTEDDRGMLTYPGAMWDLKLDDIPWDYVRSARHLHLSSYYLQKGLRPDCAELFRRTKEMGLSTSLDTNWDPDEEWGRELLDVLGHVDIFLPNREEALLISGRRTLDEALVFFADLVDVIVVTCGADGVRARRGENLYHVPAPEVTVIDAVGAGDTFNAGFLNRHLAGDPLDACLRHGVLAAAYSTTAAGGTTAFERAGGLEEFAGRHGDPPAERGPSA